MSYKPEKISPNARMHMTAGGLSRARRSAKRAATRVRRRAERRDPENAPTSLAQVCRGWID